MVRLEGGYDDGSPEGRRDEMSLPARAHQAVNHRMRAYYLPAGAGAALIVSAFLPWVFIGETPLGGVPDVAALWVLGLGLLAVVLASLSIVTRKNSRHPLLVVGLTALAILFLAYKWMVRSAAEQAWAASQAVAIVDRVPVPISPDTETGVGIYVGVVASTVLVLFGLTIVVKQVSKPYAEPEDDD